MHAWLCIEAMISISITDSLYWAQETPKVHFLVIWLGGLSKHTLGWFGGLCPQLLHNCVLYTCTWQLEHIGKKTTCSFESSPVSYTACGMPHPGSCLWGSRAIHLCWFNHLGLAARKVGIGLNVKASLEGNQYKSLTQSHFRNTNVEFSARTLHHCR